MLFSGDPACLEAQYVMIMLCTQPLLNRLLVLEGIRYPIVSVLSVITV